MTNKRLLSLLLLFIVAVVPMMGETSLKVMSYNVRLSMADDGTNSWKFRRGASAQMLQLERPALLGLQEACPPQVAYLDSVLTTYKHVGVGREDGINDGEMMAIYYDTTIFNLDRWGNFWFSETPNEVSIGWDAACKRTCTWAVLTHKATMQKVIYLNTHLDHMGPVARREEVKMIAAKVKELIAEYPDAIALLTADFNTSSTNPIFNPLRDTMKEARSTSPITDNDYTFNGFHSERPAINNEGEVVIDHIFYKNVKPRAFRVLRENYGAPFISDHFPVCLEFTF